MLPDTGERYLSTPLFADVPVDMTEDEYAISRSTSFARFDSPAGAPPKPLAASFGQPAVLPELADFVAAAIRDPANPVVMFALEWCEFCWSVRTMFKHHGIAYRSIDLDSVAYQKEDWGRKIRVAVNAQTGLRTIPQIFIGGQHVDGCADLFDARKAGRPQGVLARKTGVGPRANAARQGRKVEPCLQDAKLG